MKKKIIFILIFFIILVFGYPTFYYYYIKNSVYKVASKVLLSILEYRRYALSNNIEVGFYFDYKDNNITIFKDLNNDAKFDTNDEILKVIYIKDINKNTMLYDYFNNFNVHLKDNTFIFYPNGTCSVIDEPRDSSIFFIHINDIAKHNFYRIFRIKFSAASCELKISRVLNIENNIIEFEN